MIVVLEAYQIKTLLFISIQKCHFSGFLFSFQVSFRVASLSGIKSCYNINCFKFKQSLCNLKINTLTNLVAKFSYYANVLKTMPCMQCHFSLFVA